MTQVPRPALIAGAVGIAPFIIFTAIAWLPLEQGIRLLALQSLIYYGALTLVFLGAVHWGLAIAGFGDAEGSGLRWGRMVWSAVPFVLAFVSFYLPPRFAMIWLALAYLGTQVIDDWASRGGTAPLWYRLLRRPLTGVATLTLLISAFA